ncbi:unnamed protein product [Discula destructiva]
MKSLIAYLLLPTTAQAALAAPPSINAAIPNIPASLPGAGNDSSKNPGPRRATEAQADAPSPGTPCGDEGDWFCMTSTWQRCASGQWSAVFAVAPGTQCAPLGLADNIYFSAIASGSVPTLSGPAVTSVPMITTTDVIVSSPTSAVITVLKSSTTSSAALDTPTPDVPKADTSGGASPRGNSLWATVEVALIVAAWLLR